MRGRALGTPGPDPKSGVLLSCNYLCDLEYRYLLLGCQFPSQDLAGMLGGSSQGAKSGVLQEVADRVTKVTSTSEAWTAESDLASLFLLCDWGWFRAPSGSLDMTGLVQPCASWFIPSPLCPPQRGAGPQCGGN